MISDFQTASLFIAQKQIKISQNLNKYTFSKNY